MGGERRGNRFSCATRWLYAVRRDHQYPRDKRQHVFETADRLCGEFAKVLQMPEVMERLAAEGSTPGGITPQEFAAHIKSEIAKWGKVVKLSGARAD